MKKKYIISGLFVLAYFASKAAGNKPSFFKGRKMQIRNDALGSGLYGAKRTDHTHQGLDIVATPDEAVVSPFAGRVSRIIDVYGDGRYQGLEIITNLYYIKVFYITPLKGVLGTEIKAGQSIGIVQDVTKKYGSSITNHIHVELRQSGKLIDPKYILF